MGGSYHLSLIVDNVQRNGEGVSNTRTRMMSADKTSKRRRSSDVPTSADPPMSNSGSNRQHAPVSAFSMLQSIRYAENSPRGLCLVPSQSQQLNAQDSLNHSAWLRLGLGVTELAGEAGSGKSQIAMSLCVQAVLNGQQPQSQQSGSDLSTRAIYISLSGGGASVSRIAHRMQQMVDAEQQHRYQLLQQQQNVNANLRRGPYYQPSFDNFRRSEESQKGHSRPPVVGEEQSSQQVLAQILTLSLRNQDDLFSLLRRELPEVLQQQQHPPPRMVNHAVQGHTNHALDNGVALIVLDSIADLFRLGNGDDSCMDSTSIARRSLVLFELASVLRELSSRYNVPFLVINQISSSLQTNANIPTLGLSWENCVNTSYMVRRQRTLKQDNSKARQLFLTKSSSHAVNQRVAFHIEPRGIVVGQNEEKQALTKTNS